MLLRVGCVAWLGLAGQVIAATALSSQARSFPSPSDFRTKAWRWSSGGAIGAVFTPGEIGRERNATGGHEELIASWGDGPALGARLGLESRYGGVELSLMQSMRALEVENEFGADFPNHGGRPVAWTGGVVLYPLAPLQGRRAPGITPFLTAGLGGSFLSVDLDNIRDQTLYHSFLWSVGGGIRIEASPTDVPSATSTFVELRAARLRLWANGPLRGFDAVVVSAGLGMRL